MDDSCLISLRLSALTNEYNELRKEMREYIRLMRVDTKAFIGGLGAFLGTIKFLYPGLSFTSVVPCIPTIIFVFLCLQSILIHLVQTQAIQCAEIEQKINDLLGHECATWEHKKTKTTLRSLTSASNTASWSLIIIFVAAFLFFLFTHLSIPSPHIPGLKALYIFESLTLCLILFDLLKNRVKLMRPSKAP